jgi:hypothetical protein
MAGIRASPFGNATYFYDQSPAPISCRNPDGVLNHAHLSAWFNGGYSGWRGTSFTFILSPHTPAVKAKIVTVYPSTI